VNVRAVAVWALAAVATALALVLVVPTSADARTIGLAPPPATEAIAPTQLPACSTIDSGADADARASILLGWAPSTARFYINKGTYSQEFAPSIPCYESGAPSPTRVLMMSSRVTGTKTGSTVIATGTITWRCYDPATGQQTTVVGGDSGSTGVSFSAGSSNTIVYASGTSTISVALCPRIVSVTIVAASGYPTPDGQVNVSWVWKPAQWTSEDGGWQPGTSPSDFYPDGVELPIICTVNNSGDDLFQVIQNFFGSLAQLPACLFVPVGWDRAGRIADAWNDGPAGELANAFEASVPGGLVCGVVATIPIWDGGSVVLDTCPVDVAGPVVKTVVGWVMVLGIAALIVRRIMWTVGSGA
jgi:hypothetical protein